MLFDGTHIFFLSASVILVTAAASFTARYIKEEKTKERLLLFWALFTNAVHISSLWVDLLLKGKAYASAAMLFPTYLCYDAGWLLLLCALWKNKRSAFFKHLSAATAYISCFGGLIVLIYPQFYLNIPNVADWNVMKEIIGHDALLSGGLLLFIGGYVKIEMKNLLSFSAGMGFLAFLALTTELLFSTFGLPSPNALFILEPPIPDIPLLNSYVIFAGMLCVMYVFIRIYDSLRGNKPIGNNGR